MLAVLLRTAAAFTENQELFFFYCEPLVFLSGFLSYYGYIIDPKQLAWLQANFLAQPGEAAASKTSVLINLGSPR